MSDPLELPREGQLPESDQAVASHAGSQPVPLKAQLTYTAARSLVAFDSSQTGDVSLGAVAGGDVTSIGTQTVSHVANQTNIYVIAAQALEQAMAGRGPQAGPEERVQVLRRAQHAAAYLRGAQLLWLDDNPSYNVNERRLFRSLGIFVDLARQESEAWELFAETSYDAVISDMKRGVNPIAGLTFLTAMRQRNIAVPLIFYTMGIDPALVLPAQPFGLTERPDHLLHYIIDAVERSRI